MKKIILALTLVSLLLLVGCGGDNSPATSGSDRGTNNQFESGSDSSVIEETSKSDDSGSFTGSLKDLMMKAVPTKCTWSETSDGETFSGTTYVNGNKFRTEIETPEGNAYSISDGKYMYTWMSNKLKGMKISLEAVEAGDEDFSDLGDAGEEDSLEYSNIDANYKYDCHAWSGSSAKFNPPEDVEFQNFSKMMEKMQAMANKYESGE